LGERESDIRRQIVVVDDGSTDLTGELLRAYGDAIQTIRHETPVGFAGACNTGAAVAGGDYIVFLNNDTIPRRGWLEALVAAADAHPKAAVVGAKLLFPNDTIQHAGVVFGIDRFPHHIYAGFPADHPATSTSRPYQAVTAACCLVKRVPWQEMGGFDRAFLNGWEDIDLCLRLGEAGYQIRYCAESIVYHLESASRDVRAGEERQNRFLFAERWLAKVRPDDFDHYVNDGLLSVVYPNRYPIQLSASPLLAGITIGEDERQADRLLFERARQAAILLRNNLALNVRVHEAELRAKAAEARTRLVERQLADRSGAGTAVSVGAVTSALVERPASSGPSQPARDAAVGSPTSTENGGATTTTPGASVPEPGVTQPILGRVESPAREPGIITDQMLPIAGWALSKAGIEKVATFVDDEPLGLVEYGEPRPDVAALYPEFPDGVDCGFVGAVPMASLEDGPHKLEIRIFGRDGRVSRVGTTIEVDSTAVATGRVIARLDRPTFGQKLGKRDRLFIAGWALSPYGMESIEASVDGGPRVPLAYGALRPDVGRSYPFYPDSSHSGFNASLSLSSLAEGSHTLDVHATATDGQSTVLTVAFELDAEAPALGQVPVINDRYQEWLDRTALTEQQREQLTSKIDAQADSPTLGIVVPLVCDSVRVASVLVDSVRGQIYPTWRLVLVVPLDAPGDLRVWAKDLAVADHRITTVRTAAELSLGGLADAGIDACDAGWLAVIAPGDRLEPQALALAALHLGEHPETDLLYSDEDKQDTASGFRWDPFFKPDWSPDLILSIDYLGPLTFIRRSLLKQVGGLTAAPPGAEAYDLALRATEVTEAIAHLPHVLVSRASDLEYPPDWGVEDEPARAAVRAALKRRNVDATVEPGLQPSSKRVRYALRDTPPVTVLLPTGGKMQFLRPCLDDLLHKTTYPNLQILILDNSEGDEVAELVAELAEQHPRIRRVPVELQPFNFSALINRGASYVETPYVLLLNDDVTIVTPDWIEAMMEHAQRREVGVVGAKLLYPDGTLQHAGVVLGIYQGTAHVFKLYPGDDPGYFGLPNVVRNYLAVTFACALMRTELVGELGGLDEEHLPIAFNDVDFCLRVIESGRRVVYTPHAVLFHHESVTKKVFGQPKEIGRLRSRWGRFIEHDPFYNPNLTLQSEDASLRMD
jgi:GT2 family glycosyltransferase